MREDGLLPWRTKLRSSKYLNNLIEQDHRGIKSRTRPMLGFKNFESAAITIAGIELLRRIHKGQFTLDRLRFNGQAAPAIWYSIASISRTTDSNSFSSNSRGDRGMVSCALFPFRVLLFSSSGRIVRTGRLPLS